MSNDWIPADSPEPWDQGNDTWEPALDPRAEAQKALLDSMSPLEKVMVGAGRSLVNTGRGIADIWDMMLGNDESREERRRLVESEQYGVDALREDSPVLTGVGEVLPFLATAPLSGGLLTQMGIGAGTSMAQYDPNNEDLGDVAMMGGQGAGMTAGTMAIFGGTGRVLKAINESAKGVIKRGSPAMKEAANRLGFKMTPGVASDDIALRQLEESMKSNPAFSGLTENVTKHNQTQLNRIAARAIGEEADEITPKVLQDASERLSDVFEGIGAKLDGDDYVPINLQALKKLRNTMSREAEGYLDDLAGKYPGLKNGQMHGDEYMEFVTKIEKDMANLRGQGMGASANDLKEVRQIVDDGLERVLTGDELQALKQARGQWAMLRVLEKNNVVKGDQVMPKSLNSAMKREFGALYKRGYLTDDLSETSRLMEQMAPIVGDSGTATRNYLNFAASNPGAVAASMAMRPLARRYLESGNPVWANIMGAIQAPTPFANQAGAAVGRGLMADPADL